MLVLISASVPNNPIGTYLSFGKSDVIHGTILAFAQWPTWPTLGGCLRLGGIARHGARARSGGALRQALFIWRRSVTALRHGYARNAPRSALGYFYYDDERYRRAVNKG